MLGEPKLPSVLLQVPNHIHARYSSSALHPPGASIIFSNCLDWIQLAGLWVESNGIQ